MSTIGQTTPSDAIASVFWTSDATSPAVRLGRLLGTDFAAPDRAFDMDAIATTETPVVICAGLSDALTRAMAAGTPPSQAAARWQAEVQALLNHYRKNRAKMLLVQDRQFLAADTAMLAALSRKLDRALADLPAEPPTEPAPLLSALAAQFIASSPALRDLDDELLASSHSQDLPAPAEDAADDAFRATTASPKAEQDRAELMEHLREVQTDLAGHAREAASLRQKIKLHEAAMQDRAKALSEAEVQTAKAKAEGAELTKQKIDLTEQLQKASAHQAELAKEIEFLRAEHQRFYTSYSWKVAAPLRAVRRGLDRMRGRA